jgi:pimeloyl-ACP methyl ester carboxylesterase
VDVGRGPPAIVFIHGFTCGRADWTPQLDALSLQHRCIAVDLPGHGRSPPAVGSIATMAAAVNAALDALQLDAVVLAGHSMGCRVVSETWSQAPQRVRGIIYVDGSILAPEAADTAVRRTAAMIDALGMDGFIARLYDGFFVADTNSAVREAINARRTAIDFDFARELFLDIVRFDAARSHTLLEALGVPALVIQSSALDPALHRVSLQPGATSPWAEAVRARARDVTTVVIPGGGHFPTLEAPEATNAAIAAFVEQIGRSPRA